MRIAAELSLLYRDWVRLETTYFSVRVDVLWWHVSINLHRKISPGRQPVRVRVFIGSTNFYLRLHTKHKSVMIDRTFGKVVSYYSLCGRFIKWGPRSYV